MALVFTALNREFIEQVRSEGGKIALFDFIENLSNNIQSGTGTLVGGTVTITAKITATSRVFVNMTDVNGGSVADLAALLVNNLVVGTLTTGSFDVTAIDGAAGAQIVGCTAIFDWLVIG